MFRQMSYATRTLVAAATFALPTIALAQADTRPVVVVFKFDNNSIGAGRAEFDGTQTGIQDLLITDLASNAKVRLVDRSHLNEVLTEQNLAKTGQIDPTTAVRLGKILGAQYAVTGGFMSDGKGSVILTGRTIDIETTQIANPQKITGKSDNVLAAIADLSTRISSNMNLAPKAGTGRSGDDDAKSAAVQSGVTKSTAKNSAPKTAAAKPMPGDVEMYSKPIDAAVVKKTMSTKMDVATVKLYSVALQEMDNKNNAKAKELLNQVLAKYPDYEPAQRNLKKLG